MEFANRVYLIEIASNEKHLDEDNQQNELYLAIQLQHNPLLVDEHFLKILFV
jgi:hypothetical protein